MTAHLTITTGTSTSGADALREHVRWADAERRWRPRRMDRPHPPMAPADPEGRQALRDGAFLTQMA